MHLIDASQEVGALAPTFKDTQNRALAPEEILFFRSWLLEKPETLSLPRLAVRRHLRDVRQLPPFKRGHRIFRKQRVCLCVPKPFPHDLIRWLQPQRPASRVMRIDGHEMHQPHLDPTQRIGLRFWSKSPGQRGTRHLPKTAKPYPGSQQARLRLNDAVAFRMRDDWVKAH